MRILIAISLLAFSGCSTAPIAGTLDCFFPSRGQTNDDRIPPPGVPRRPRGDDPLLPFEPARPDR